MLHFILSLFFLAATYTPMTADEMTSFKNQVNEALTKAGKKINDVINDAATSGNLISAVDKMKVIQAKNMLKAKDALAQAVLRGESLRSPAVRQQLLQLLNSDNLTDTDVIDFQSLINQEKEKIHAFDATTAPAPVK